MTAVQQAKDLLGLVTTPSALVTGTFLTFAGRAIKENAARVDPIRMWFALAAAFAAVGVTGALTALMTPLAWRSVFTYKGGIEAVLVVYLMITLSVIGTLAYSIWILARCVGELRRPSQ